ncbi:hypothetical protein KQI84_07405 [bacterium]|nr:hypothetical protein [bacterium]
MMNSETIRRLQEYLDTHPDEPLSPVLQREVDGDPNLRALWEELQAVDEMLGETDELPEGLHDRIMHGIGAAPAPSRRAKVRVLLLAPLAAAAAVVLFLALNFEPMKQEPITRHSPKNSSTEQIAPNLDFSELTISQELKAPGDFVRQKRDRAIESAEGLLAGVVKVLPRLPEDSPPPTPTRESRSAQQTHRSRRA